MNANAPNIPPVITPTAPDPTSAPPPRFKFLLVAVVWLTVVFIGTGVTFILPEMFVSAVRIKVQPDPPQVSGLTDTTGGGAAYDPSFLLTQARLIDSETVLTNVVDALDLTTVWGKRYYDNQKLRLSEALLLLQGRLDVRPMTNTSLIWIRVYSESAPDAALVANEVAKAYHLWRVNNVQRRLRKTIEELEKQLALQEQKVERLKFELTGLAGAAEAFALNSSQKLTYLEKQKAFETELDLSQLLVRRINAEKVNLQLPLSELVMIVDKAVPGLKPVRPNVPLNIILSIILGAMVGVMLAGLVYLFQWRAYRRKIGVYGAAHSPGLRNALRMIIGLAVGVIAGYNCAMPLVASSLISFPLVLAAGGIGLGFVELANSTPLPPVPPAADGSPESAPPKSF